jgi:hypothetical protein
MSLIVDINPVPWEILDLVKARILKNRANRQKRQPEKPGELRRVMQVDNGLLAKQRWEEPSFIFGGDFPFLYILKNTRAVAGGVNSTFAFTLKINDVFVAEIDFKEMGKPKGYILIWSNNETDVKSVKSYLGQSARFRIYEGYLGRFYDQYEDRANPYQQLEAGPVPSYFTAYRGVGTVYVTLLQEYTAIILNQSEPRPGDIIDIEIKVTYTAQFLREISLPIGYPNYAYISGGFMESGADPLPGDASNIKKGKLAFVSTAGPLGNTYNSGGQNSFGFASFGVGQTTKYTFKFPTDPAPGDGEGEGEND